MKFEKFSEFKIKENMIKGNGFNIKAEQAEEFTEFINNFIHFYNEAMTIVEKDNDV